MKRVDREGNLDTVFAMNGRVEEERRLTESVLTGTFESLWPKLEEALSHVSEGAEPRRRDERELLEEILALVTANRSAAAGLSEEEVFFSSLGKHAPTDLLSRLREIAGPSGVVEFSPGSPTKIILSQRYDDLPESDKSFLRAAARNLPLRGGKLVILQKPDMEPPA